LKSFTSLPPLPLRFPFFRLRLLLLLL
jgi:hypothetical protein